MEHHTTPYVWRDEVPSVPAPPSEHGPEEQDTVIVDGEAMSYREYRETDRSGPERV